MDAIALALTWLAVVAARERLGAPWFPPLPLGVSAPLGWLIVPLWLAVVGRTGGSLPRGVAVATGMAALGLFLARIEVNRTLLVGFALASGPALIGARAATAAVARRWAAPRRVVVVGPAEAAAVVSRALAAQGAAAESCRPELLLAELTGTPADEVVVAGLPDAETLAAVSSAADALGLPWSLDASFVGPRVATAELTDADGYPLLTLRAASDSAPDLWLKRTFDGLGALVGLAVVAVPLVVLAAAIRAADGGPALFRQTRIGRYGRPFTMYKLRTMVSDAEQRRASLEPHNPIAGPAFKLPRDPRVTRIGAVLRRWSVDELPQLLNVLRGEMSLVGPRPPLPDEVARYEPWQRRRLSVRPGLTGLWQVSGRADLPFDQWIQLDLQYVDSWSLWLDARLLARTVPAVVRGTGAR